MSQAVTSRERVLWLLAGGVAVLVPVALSKIWKRCNKTSASSTFSLNRPTAGPRSDKKLPVGNHALQLYSLGTPNGQKVTILLEELGVAYDAWNINIGKGDQFGSGFVEINPNSKIPALVDQDFKSPENPTHPLAVFESASILLHLAKKHNKFIPPQDDVEKTAELMNWLFFQVGAAPYFGQFGHFFHYASEKLPYAIARYKMETQRLLDVLDQRLAHRDWVVGSDITIADMAWFPWVVCLDVFYHGSEELELKKYKNVQKWIARMNARPAVVAGMSKEYQQIP